MLTGVQSGNVAVWLTSIGAGALVDKLRVVHAAVGWMTRFSSTIEAGQEPGSACTFKVRSIPPPDRAAR
jgi:hypothetical protein